MSKRNAKPKPIEHEHDEFAGAGRGLVIRLVPVVIVVAIVCGVVFWVRPELRQRVSASMEESARVSFEWPPAASNTTWLPSHEQRRLTELVEGMVSADPFDQESLGEAHSLLMSQGWFASDLRLERGPDASVLVDATWRTPAAVVRLGEREHLVGVGGELLPLEYDAGQSWPVR
ncbi:MAG: hypothetical protein ACYTF7_06590, partial [Planctomycetota bacterium]